VAPVRPLEPLTSPSDVSVSGGAYEAQQWYNKAEGAGMSVPTPS